MALPIPWNVLEKLLQGQYDYGTCSRKIAEFFKNTEENSDPGKLTANLWRQDPDPKWLERFLFSVLDVSPSDIQVAKKALELRRTGRLLRKAFLDATLTPKETELVGAMLQNIPLPEPESISELKTYLWKAWDHLVESNAPRKASDSAGIPLSELDLPNYDLRILMLALTTESEALKERINWISENVDPYSMKAMGRLLPRLRIYDEMVQEIHCLVKKLEAGEVIGANVLTLEDAMKKDGYTKWHKKMEKESENQKLLEAISLQKQKRIPTLNLIALSTLCRWVQEAKGVHASPLYWILQALSIYDKGHFKIEVGNLTQQLSSLLTNTSIQIVGNQLVGFFDHAQEIGFVTWIAKDFLTRPYESILSDSQNVDFKALVSQNINRDGIIERLLENPRVFNRPGLVSYIASLTRSSAILSKIAMRKELHTGASNRDVPVELLRNPTKISLLLLRPLVNTRLVPLVDLKQIAKQKSGIRPEVLSEILSYLKSRGERV